MAESGGRFCPLCGEAAGLQDRFCRWCGESLLAPPLGEGRAPTSGGDTNALPRRGRASWLGRSRGCTGTVINTMVLLIAACAVIGASLGS